MTTIARRLTRRPMLALAVLCGASVLAEAGNVQFVADAVQSLPGQGTKSGKLQVGDKGSRFEFVENGQTIVHITRIDGIVRVLLPAHKSYIEFQAPPGAVPASMTPEAPCAPSPDIDCRNEGDEQTPLGTLQRWTITPKGAPTGMRVWWDGKRRMPLRQELPDGSVMQATLKGSEQFDGRAVESFDIALTMRDGKQHTGRVLYAPDIGLTVLEQQPAGATRELRNVKIVAMDPAQLEVPQGFTKVDPAAVPPPSQQQQPR